MGFVLFGSYCISPKVKSKINISPIFALKTKKSQHLAETFVSDLARARTQDHLLRRQMV